MNESPSPQAAAPQAAAPHAVASQAMASHTPSPQAVASMKALTARFFRRGLILALGSGMLYGLFTAFLTLGMASGPWVEWYSDTQTLLSTFMVIYVLGMLGSGINDLVSALWMIGKAGVKGKFLELLRCFKSKPGFVMVLCALIGGPIANGCYIIALQLAGPMAAPVTALCPAIGAIIARIAFKQQLNARMVCGILICLVAALMASSTAFTGFSVDMDFLLGMLFAFIAALGWGIEGAVAGFGTAVMDYELSVSIRQTFSGLLTLVIAVPLLCLVGGSILMAPTLTFAALSSPSAMFWFALSGLCAGLSFSFWYKGNAMSGTALGMACNGTYAFFVPLFCWLIIGLILGQAGWTLTALDWASAIIMVAGIFVIVINPLDLFRKKKEVTHA